MPISCKSSRRCMKVVWKSLRRWAEIISQTLPTRYRNGVYPVVFGLPTSHNGDAHPIAVQFRHTYRLNSARLFLPSATYFGILVRFSLYLNHRHFLDGAKGISRAAVATFRKFHKIFRLLWQYHGYCSCLGKAVRVFHPCSVYIVVWVILNEYTDHLT